MYDFLFYKPIYNLIVYLSEHLVSFGWAIIISTIIIKLILYPLFSSQIKNQIAVKKAQPELKKIQEKLKDKKISQAERQALMFKMMEVNKKYGVKMFAPLVNMVIQITILLTLYLVIKKGFPDIKTEYLYDFVKSPENINFNFYGIDLLKPSIIIAILASVTQFIYTSVSMPDVKFSDLKAGNSSKEDMMKTFMVYIKYFMPLMIFFVLLGLNSALGLYWIISNIFMSLQEKRVRADKEELKKITEELKNKKDNK